jgi:hypothetical protein
MANALRVGDHLLERLGASAESEAEKLGGDGKPKTRKTEEVAS